MKRDMDLIRSILLLAEAQPAGELLRDFSTLETEHRADRRTVIEHVLLAQRSGLVEATFSWALGDDAAAVVTRLTPAGHDFIEQARSPTIWSSAKEAAAKAGVGATVEVLKTILAELTKTALTAYLRTH